MSAEANTIFQWIGVGVVILICIIYVFRKLRRPRLPNNGNTEGCEGCPLLDNCSKKSCSDHHHSGRSSCH